MKKKALVTGITGQDGAYLAQFLLNKGYDVYGSYRRSASFNGWRLEELGIAQDVKMVELELSDSNSIARALDKAKPSEVYNLAAQSFVASSFEQPIYTADVDALGPTRLLEGILQADRSIRYYQASTSEMFGKVQTVPQNENTPFYPRSPYGVAKLYGHWITINYRESYNLHASSGVLFNHESPLRGLEFVTRKITSQLARIKHGQTQPLELGNMDAKRDWGFAGDYVEGIWHIVQQETPGDFVLATGQAYTVKEFVARSAALCGFDLEWSGDAEKEMAVDRKTGKTIIRVNPQFFRPAEVDLLIGDPSKAEKILGWKRKVNFDGLVEMMVKADLDKASKGIKN